MHDTIDSKVGNECRSERYNRLFEIERPVGQPFSKAPLRYRTAETREQGNVPARPYPQCGVVWEMHRQHFGKDGDPLLQVNGFLWQIKISTLQSPAFSRAMRCRTGVVHDLDHGQHDRNLDKDADYSRKRRAGVEPEKTDRSGDGQLEEVASADERGWGR